MVDDMDRGDWHRQFARELFNVTWDLIEKVDRSSEDEVNMLLAAAASRWHWGEVGGAEERATGDWQVAHAASLLNESGLALRFARRHLLAAERAHWDGWRLASAHEGMARAWATAGNALEREHHLAAAREALAREPSAEDRQVVEEQLATVPRL